MTTTVEKFKKAFPECADYSKEEAIAFMTSFKKEKRNVDKWITKRVDYYGNRVK
jgi:hypothetical protein